jgi:uncharacterized protein YPO0396
LRERVSLLSKLEEYRDFREIDWSSVASEIAALEEERHQLENASDILRQLNEKLTCRRKSHRRWQPKTHEEDKNSVD